MPATGKTNTKSRGKPYVGRGSVQALAKAQAEAAAQDEAVHDFKQYVNGERTLTIEFKHNVYDEQWSIKVFTKKLAGVGIGHPTKYRYEINNLIIHRDTNQFETLMVTDTHGGMQGTPIPLQSIVDSAENNPQAIIEWHPTAVNALQLLRILLVYYLVYAVAIATSNQSSQIYIDILQPVFSSSKLNLILTPGSDKTITLEPTKIDQLIVSLLKQMATNKFNSRGDPHSIIINTIILNHNITADTADRDIITALVEIERDKLVQSGGGGMKKKRNKKRSKKRNKKRSKKRKSKKSKKRKQ